MKQFDLVSAINRITPKSVEFHAVGKDWDGNWSRMAFLGPNTNLQKRIKGLTKDSTYEEILTPPKNKLDEGALTHDLAYHKYKDLARRHKADKKLAKLAQSVIDDTEEYAVNRALARVVKAIMDTKVKVGFGILDAFNPGVIGDLAFDNRSKLGQQLVGLLTVAGIVGIPKLIEYLREKKDGGLLEAYY